MKPSKRSKVERKNEHQLYCAKQTELIQYTQYCTQKHFVSIKRMKTHSFTLLMASFKSHFFFSTYFAIVAIFIRSTSDNLRLLRNKVSKL